MIKTLLYLLIICLLISCNGSDNGMKIVFTGDIILDRGVNDELRIHGDSLLFNSFNFLNKQDFLMVNLEGTLTDSGDIQNDRFNFKASKNRAAILKKGGVTHVSVANNHVFDYGQIGYKNTIDALLSNNLKPLGNTSKPVIIQKGKYQCAILSASLTVYNDSLPISTISDLKSSVVRFRNEWKNIPLVLYIHWGLELQPTPEQWQKNLASDLIELGVDAIIGHHPHVTQSVEFIKNKAIFYSLGNFIADAYLPDTDLSYAIEMDIKKGIYKIGIIPIRLKNYFPEKTEFKDEIADLKKHIKYSNVCFTNEKGRWIPRPTENIDFSEPTNLWMISENNTISNIKRLSTNSYLLQFQKNEECANVINLHGALSEFQIGDINNDNKTDVLIGIGKSVKFDPTIKKRINIYTYQNKALEPLWLGTKFINDIESFDIIKHNNINYLTTIESINSAEKIKRIYEWDDFGFALTELN